MPEMPLHSLNWYAGWSYILAAFVSGTLIGLGFHRDDFWGGYNSFRRRLARLGHIALAALGMMNVLFGLAPIPPRGLWQADAASWCFVLGGAAMPAVCFLTAWQPGCRALFFIPVTLLVAAAVCTLWGTSL
jgi:hypothetical protein